MIIGYGTERDIDHCLVKNTYGDEWDGKKWGVEGFAKIAFTAMKNFTPQLEHIVRPQKEHDGRRKQFGIQTL